ncbi:hypothetical protein F7725_015425 [Dissostichus mawsoni]|uniref:CLIC N-terminal domain-containing protein n=1 Tax=Dissostichus mawsoni TaxID=36200 RepID=A0A7J5YKW1_DISMA|nr:hypothetical protein F7725_015425 [Dissostichus mawsoni]
MAESPKIELFVKASVDAESVGNCPFSQRLFMILWLKGANFTLTTVDMKSYTLFAVLLQGPCCAEGSGSGLSAPFLIFNDEVKTDTNKIEEFLEEKLAQPEYPKLCCRYKESNGAGDDIFRKFSGYIKNPNSGINNMLETKFLSTLVVCKQYRDFDIPKELKGLTRYLDNAYKQDQFRYTCPNASEILIAYHSVAKYLNK